MITAIKGIRVFVTSRLIGLLTLLWGCLTVNAYNFESDGIYYAIVYDGNVSVAVSVVGGYQSYSGDIVIPSQVTYNGKTYSVTSIGDMAFDGCSGLTSVTIPGSVTSIDDRAFSGCSGLTSIAIPNSVTYIGNSAFYRCTSLASITIPNSVTSIDGGVFSGCSGLTSVTIPSSVTKIGMDAFSGCSGLTSITIPNSVTKIGMYAFSGCSGLTSITIPNSVTTIGMYAFDGCSGLTSIKVEQGNRYFDSRNNCNAIIETSSNTLIVGCNNTIIPKGVTYIGDFSFKNCSDLTSVDIPNSVMSIGYRAFKGCSGLISITIPNSVTSVGADAFDGTAWYDNQPDGLMYIGRVAYKYKGEMLEKTHITIKDGTTEIADHAFESCYNLTSVDIPNSVISIGYRAFDGCSGLTSITIPNSVTSVGADAFDGTAWYDNQPDGLMYIGRVAYKYKGEMPENTHITIKEGTTEIAGNAFESCYNLTSVTIPNSVTNIGQYTFEGCILANVYCYAANVPNIKPHTFSFYSALTLHVPSDLIEQYKLSYPWNMFDKIVALTDDDPKPTAIEGIVVSPNDDAYYNLLGRKVIPNQKGIYIHKGKKIIVK